MSVSHIEKIEIGIIGQGSLASLIAARLVNAEFSLNVLENQFSKQISPCVRCYNSPIALVSLF